jgi:hypothetical protein
MNQCNECITIIRSFLFKFVMTISKIGMQLMSMYIYIYKKFTIVLGLKSRVVTVGIRALGLDPEDH